MDNIQGIPYTQVRFDKDGKRLSQPAVPANTTDLIVVSHGWNNTEADAVDLYTKLFTNFANLTKDDPAYAGRKVAILGVIWPAQKFDDLMTQIEGSGKASGGAKSLGAGDKAEAEKTMREAIERVRPLFQEPGDEARLAKLEELTKLVPKLETDSAAQETFVKTIRQLLDRGPTSAEQIHREDASDVLFEAQPPNIFANATKPAPAAGTGQEAAQSAAKSTAAGPATGKAAGIGSFFSKAAHAVTNLMNLTTYFEMKQRAGTVGKNGVAPLIDSLAGVDRIHLVGHSFGGRVVAATAASSSTNKLHSMSLLQAAFSHNGFSKIGHGFFRSVIEQKRVAGPIIITHTKNDKAVGTAYPAASRISGDISKAFGDAKDKFGGLGRNGAQQMENTEISGSAKELLESKKGYNFEAGHIHNLLSDTFILDPKGGDAHGFVFVPQVAWAISRAML